MNGMVTVTIMVSEDAESCDINELIHHSLYPFGHRLIKVAKRTIIHFFINSRFH